mgnify:CR=1 FL=1
MSAGGERAPLATLATANEPGFEVSERVGRGLWRARETSTLRVRASAAESPGVSRCTSCTGPTYSQFGIKCLRNALQLCEAQLTAIATADERMQ